MCADSWNSAVPVVRQDVHCSYNWPRADTHGAGERTSRDGGHSDFSNVWFLFDAISPTYSFKPFPRAISMSAMCLLFLPSHFPEIPPSCFYLEAAILDISIFTGSTGTSQLPSMSCPRIRPVWAQAPSHRRDPSCSLAQSPKCPVGLGNAILCISNRTLIDFEFLLPLVNNINPKVPGLGK